MLLRPLLETSAAGATQLPQRFSWLKKVSATNANKLYSTRVPWGTHRVEGQRALQERQEHKRNDHGPSEHSRKGKIKLLTPYDLSQRIETLCMKGDLRGAISSVKEAPLDAQNAVVWATLIRSVITNGKYQEAYRLFIDMKRRGIRPTSRTYSTLLKGYAQIDDWERFPLQLDNVCSVYDQLRQHHGMVQPDGGPDDELSNIPYNLLITIFGKAQRFQRMFDVFNAMPPKGPLAPDMHTFTVLITAIGNRQLSAFATPPEGKDAEADPLPSANELAYKNASDAKLIWRQLLRVCRTPDSHAIRAILKPLSRGRPSDQNFALDIAHEYLGLSPPGKQSIPAKLPLHEQTLEAVLATSNAARRYRYTLHYIQQVIDSRPVLLLNRKHMDYALHAHAALACMDPGESEQALEMLQWMLRMQALPRAPGLDRDTGGIGPQIKPATSTYDIVALACWNGGDWPNACRVFELMTGYSRDQFRGEMKAPPTSSSRQGLRPSAIFMSSFIRAATKTYDPENVRQALNILGHYGLDNILEEVTDPGHPSQRKLRRQDSNRAFYASKLVEALHIALPQMLKSADYDQVLKTRWKDMLRRAEEIIPSRPVREVGQLRSS
ncbi:hypothetical protein JB92DRAFT_2908642 [Gautieria morchelliformis]|nr:hypothetical protein JB92DRAFT_2908642 [Gautieria morchelliformis]